MKPKKQRKIITHYPPHELTNGRGDKILSVRKWHITDSFYQYLYKCETMILIGHTKEMIPMQILAEQIWFINKHGKSYKGIDSKQDLILKPKTK